LVCVWLSVELGIPWLAKADAVAALGVAMIVIWVSLQLGQRTIDGLLDRAPDGLDDEIEAAVAAIPGVEHVDAVRVRRSGAETFADVTISVDHTRSLADAHVVAHTAEAAIHSAVPQSQAMVHIDPHDPELEAAAGVPEPAPAEAD
jgi:divalent metal cation (Fe/Co/Zn/Cd) transporter